MEHRANSASRLVAGSACALALVTIGLVLHRSGAGIDLTDEGFYLNWMHTPHDYPAAVTFFGFLHQPFFRLLDGNIAALRIANLAATLGLSYWLLREALRLGEVARHGVASRDFIVLLPLALSGWMLLRYWLPTPSYNWLVLQGLLVAAIGALRLYSFRADDMPSLPTLLTASVLVGLGGFITAFAKPSSGVMLAGLLALIALPLHRGRLLGLAMAGVVATAMAGMAIWLIDGSVAGFVTRIRLALEQMALLDGGQRLLRLGWPRVSWIGLFGGLLLLVLGFAMTNRLASRATRALAGTAAGLCMAVGILVWRGDLLPKPQIWLDGLMLAAGLGGVILALRPRSGLVHHWRLVVLLALLPMAFTAGTGNSFWDLAPLALVFWCALAVLLVSSCPTSAYREAALASSALVSVLSVAIGLSISMETPYRQSTPLRLQTQVTRLGPAHAELRLDREMSAYIEALRRPLDQEAAVAIIDLTGLHPGTIHMVGGHAVGAPWLIAGYGGSEALIRQQLGLVSCARMARAWLLSAGDGDLPFMQKLLAANAIDPSMTHEAVARARSPRDGRMHVLLRPIGPAAGIETNCQDKRRAG